MAHPPTCAPLPKWAPLSPGEPDWFPGHRDSNPTSGEPACSGPPWQGPFSWPSWLLPRPMVADISNSTILSIPPKTSGSARRLVSSRLCSTLPATQQYKQTPPAARIDKRYNTQSASCKKQNGTVSQVYCTLTEEGESSRCGVCDSSESDKAHPPHLALDGSDR